MFTKNRNDQVRISIIKTCLAEVELMNLVDNEAEYPENEHDLRPWRQRRSRLDDKRRSVRVKVYGRVGRLSWIFLVLGIVESAEENVAKQEEKGNIENGFVDEGDLRRGYEAWVAIPIDLE